MLVAGVPGSGKSEWMRAAVASLMVTNTPNTVRLILIDPKKNAFGELSGSDYLWRSESLIDTPEGQVIPVLTHLIRRCSIVTSASEKCQRTIFWIINERPDFSSRALSAWSTNTRNFSWAQEKRPTVSKLKRASCVLLRWAAPPVFTWC